jgi:4'-phosphopantetheinyl transferase
VKAVLEPASDEVHSWCVSLDVPPDTSAGLYASLASDERNRSARLRFERDRRRFVVAHGALREVLGRYLGIPPDSVRFVYNAFGKPELSPELGQLKFSLSHSADLALIAIAADAEIGVDLELIREQSDWAEIARCFFSAAERDRLNRLPSHRYPQAFFGCWTKKEAYVKARGEGLAIPLTSFSVPLTSDPALAPVDPDGTGTDAVLARRWSLYTLRPAPGYIGALAVEGRGRRLRQWHWQASLER